MRVRWLLPACGLLLAMAHWAPVKAADPLPGNQPAALEHSADFTQRMSAIELLGRRRDHASAAELLKDLQDTDSAIRGQAAEALGLVCAPESVLPLAQALHDTASDVREKAAWALSRFSGEALQPATEIIGDAVQHLGKEAPQPLITALIIALAKIRTAPAAVILFSALAKRHNDDAMDKVMQCYLGVSPGAYAVEALIHAIPQADSRDKPSLLEWLSDTGDDRAIPTLLEAAQNPDVAVSIGATRDLYRFRQDPRVSSALHILAKDGDPCVRAAAMNGFQRPSEPVDIPLLLTALKDLNPRVSAAAANCLKDEVDPRIPAWMVQALADSDMFVRIYAAQALITRKDTAVLPDVRALLKDIPKTQADAAQSVICALVPGEMRKSIFALLVEYATVPEFIDGKQNHRYIELQMTFDMDLRNRDTILAALAIGQPPALRVGALRAEQTIQDARALPLILSALRDDDDIAVSNAALNVLAQERGNAGGPDDHFGMRLAPRRAHGRFAGRGPEKEMLNEESVFADPRLIAPLIARLAGMDQTTPLESDRNKADARRDVIRLLGWTGDPRAADALAGLLQSPERSMRSAAAYALVNCDDARAVDPLLAELRDADGANLEMMPAIAVSRLRDPRVLPALTDIANTHAQPKVRQSACLALGFTDDARAVAPLTAVLLRDTNPEVREFAAFALGQLADTHAVAALLIGLQDNVEWARSAAACALGQIGDARAVPALKQVADDPDMHFRLRVGTALALLGERRGFGLLGDVVLGSDLPYAYYATRTLAELPDERALDALCPALDNSHTTFNFPAAAIQGLEQIGGARAIQTLLDQQHQLECGYDENIIDQALAATGDTHARDAVLARLLSSLGPHKFLQHPDDITTATLTNDQRMVAPLEDALVDSPELSTALLRLGSARGLPYVLAQMPEHPGEFNDVCYAAARHPWSEADRQKIIAALVPQLEALAKTRVSAARALMAFHDPRGAAVLLATYEAFPRGATHEDARAALEELDPASDGAALPGLLELLPAASGARREELIYLLGAIATHHPHTEALKTVVPQLTAELRNDDPRLREAAAQTLGRLGDTRACADLIAKLTDPASRVCEQAIIALGHIPDQTHQAVTPLITLLHDESSPRLRATAVTALRTLTGQTFGDDAAQWAAWLKQR